MIVGVTEEVGYRVEIEPDEYNDFQCAVEEGRFKEWIKDRNTEEIHNEPEAWIDSGSEEYDEYMAALRDNLDEKNHG
ncbi:MAG: hypothetical protein KAJ03_04130 [Gammaproteobacteria bacterium]|nr:hypothetical protein [Gammaproteobacteria bacterium]